MTCHPILTTEFQSTLSVRRATRIYSSDTKILLISIHALRKESDHAWAHAHPAEAISIHALRKESDGGALDFWDEKGISIHALRKESDAGS